MAINALETTQNAADAIHDFFEGPAKDAFEELSDKAKGFASSVFERVEKMQIGDRVTGRLKISYNQFWVDKHEERANVIKGGIDKVTEQLSDLSDKSAQIITSMQELRDRGVVTPSLQKRLEKIEKEKGRLAIEKEKKQLKYEEREGIKNRFIEKRNAIADKLIEYYDGRLEPIESKISKLQLSADVMELDLKVDEIKHKDSVAKLNDIERIKGDLERNPAISKKDVREIEKHLKGGRKAAEKEQASIFDLRAELIQQKQKVQQVDEQKAEPYRKKREEFESIKRQNVESPPDRVAIKQRDEAKYEKRIESLVNRVMPESSSSSEREQFWRLDDIVENWNSALSSENENSRDTIKAEQLKKFLKITDFSVDSRMTTADFKSAYLEYKKIMWRYNYRTGVIMNAE